MTMPAVMAELMGERDPIGHAALQFLRQRGLTVLQSAAGMAAAGWTSTDLFRWIGLCDDGHLWYLLAVADEMAEHYERWGD